MSKIPSCEEIIANNPDSPTNGTICKLMRESGAGIGSFIDFVSTPAGSLVLLLVVVMLIGAFGFAIARIILGFSNR